MCDEEKLVGWSCIHDGACAPYTLQADGPQASPLDRRIP